jgi:7-keto-8-aminopelargonate synthetase-like enzyme
LRILGPTKVEQDGRVLISFAGTNYLGLSFHPRILEALHSTARRSGFGMGASRKTTGTTDEVLGLEQRAAQFTQTEAAIATTSGTLANAGVLDGLRGEIDHWLVDEQAHSSFARFLPISGAAIHTYAHANAADVAARRKALPGRAAVYMDVVFPMTGEVAPIREIAEASGDAWLVFDEAHSLGTMGDGGRGLSAASALPPERTILTATLSKALGCSGGLILGPEGILSLIRERSEILASTGALSPALAAAGTVAFDVMEEEPERFERLRSNIALMRELLSLSASPAAAPIFSRSEDAAQRSDAARKAGFLVPLVSSYPGAPSQPTIRWIVSSEHTEDEICTVARILTRL